MPRTSSVVTEFFAPRIFPDLALSFTTLAFGDVDEEERYVAWRRPSRRAAWGAPVACALASVGLSAMYDAQYAGLGLPVLPLLAVWLIAAPLLGAACAVHVVAARRWPRSADAATSGGLVALTAALAAGEAACGAPGYFHAQLLPLAAFACASRHLPFRNALRTVLPAFSLYLGAIALQVQLLDVPLGRWYHVTLGRTRDRLQHDGEYSGSGQDDVTAMLFAVAIIVGALLCCLQLMYRTEKAERVGFVTARTVLTQHAEVLAEDNRIEDLLGNIVPPSKVAELRETRGVVVDVVEQCTCVCAEITGFADWADGVPAQQALELLNDIFAAFDSIAAKTECEKIKSFGPQVWYVAGAPFKSDGRDHSTSAAECAMMMLQAVEAYREQLCERGAEGVATSVAVTGVRIGVECGPIAAGVMGVGPLRYDAWGETIAVATRMKEGAHDNTIVCSSTFVESGQLHGHYIFEKKGMISVKNLGNIVGYYLQGRTFSQEYTAKRSTVSNMLRVKPVVVSNITAAVRECTAFPSSTDLWTFLDPPKIDRSAPSHELGLAQWCVYRPLWFPEIVEGRGRWRLLRNWKRLFSTALPPRMLSEFTLKGHTFVDADVEMEWEHDFRWAHAGQGQLTGGFVLVALLLCMCVACVIGQAMLDPCSADHDWLGEDVVEKGTSEYGESRQSGSQDGCLGLYRWGEYSLLLIPIAVMMFVTFTKVYRKLAQVTIFAFVVTEAWFLSGFGNRHNPELLSDVAWFASLPLIAYAYFGGYLRAAASVLAAWTTTIFLLWAMPPSRWDVLLLSGPLHIIGVFMGGYWERAQRLEFAWWRHMENTGVGKERSATRSTNVLEYVLPRAIAKELAAFRDNISDDFDHLEGAVLVAEFHGFTSLCHCLDALGPEGADGASSTPLALGLLHDAFSIVNRLTQVYGVSFLSYNGSRVIITSGLGHEDHPEHPGFLDFDPEFEAASTRQDAASRLVGLGKHLCTALAQFNEQRGISPDACLDVRVGVAVGNIKGGVVGCKRFSYDVWGEAVTAAQKLEAHCPAGMVQTCEQTYALVHDEFMWEEGRPIHGKGFKETSTWRPLERRDGNATPSGVDLSVSPLKNRGFNDSVHFSQGGQWNSIKPIKPQGKPSRGRRVLRAAVTGGGAWKPRPPEKKEEALASAVSAVSAINAFAMKPVRPQIGP